MQQTRALLVLALLLAAGLAALFIATQSTRSPRSKKPQKSPRRQGRAGFVVEEKTAASSASAASAASAFVEKAASSSPAFVVEEKDNDNEWVLVASDSNRGNYVGCTSVFDIGTVCPRSATYEMYDDRSIRHYRRLNITPYQRCGADVRAAVARHLLAEWGEGNKVGTEAESAAMIERRWGSGADVMYVAALDEDEQQQQLVGVVGVDRLQFLPVISHLYVVPEFRGKGHSARLLDIAEDYVRLDLRFREVYLWCEPRLTGMYAARGYVVAPEMGDKSSSAVVMRLDLKRVRDAL